MRGIIGPGLGLSSLDLHLPRLGRFLAHGEDDAPLEVLAEAGLDDRLLDLAAALLVGEDTDVVAAGRLHDGPLGQTDGGDGGDGDAGHGEFLGRVVSVII